MCRKLFFLYVKVFIIIIFIGFFIPYMLNILINLITYNNFPFNNSIYVIDNNTGNRTFFNLIIKLISKMIEF